MTFMPFCLILMSILGSNGRSQSSLPAQFSEWGLLVGSVEILFVATVAFVMYYELPLGKWLSVGMKSLLSFVTVGLFHRSQTIPIQETIKEVVRTSKLGH